MGSLSPAPTACGASCPPAPTEVHPPLRGRCAMCDGPQSTSCCRLGTPPRQDPGVHMLVVVTVWGRWLQGSV